MPDIINALLAIIAVLLVAHLIGSLLLRPVLPDIGSPPLKHLLCVVFGIGAIGALTLVAGVTTGYSSRSIKAIYLCLGTLTLILYLRRFRSLRHLHLPAMREIGWPETVLLAILVIHFTLYVLTGFSYPYGSDSFSYIFLAQEYLRLGHFMPMKLEPLQELMPLFKAPCLFELVYLNLLGMANLIAISLFAKIQFIMAMLLVFFITREIGGRKSGWLAVAIVLTEPIIAYFAGESADNYFITISFQICCLYLLWLYCNSPKRPFLILAGILGGMMVAAKLTNCYYLFMMVLLLPLLICASKKEIEAPPWKRWLSALRESLVFILPAVLVAGLFPLILYVASGDTLFGLDWIFAKPGSLPRETWIYPYYHLEYNPLLRYRSIFEASPDFPLHLAKIKELLSYYLRNPLKVKAYPDWIYSHTPLALVLVLGVPLSVACIRRCDPYLRWIAAVLLGGYCIKLANFPLIIPPKSEMFQIVPSAMLISVCIGRCFSKESNNDKGNLPAPRIPIAGILRDPVRICLLVLLPFIFINLYYVKGQYQDLIKTYSFKDRQHLATMFKQQWFVENLTENDVLYGRLTNQICYISKPEVKQFFWESMLFVPWSRIEARIFSTNANYLFDASKPPESLKAAYQKILPILQRRNPKLYDNLVRALGLYEENYVKKTAFLQQHFERVHQDESGVVYKISEPK